MPSARKRRLRKIIKGFLNRKDRTGTKTNATYEERVSASEALNLLNEADLKTALGIALDGDKISYDADADGVLRDDFKPFDASEQVDTEGNGIGDNQLIVDLYSQMVVLGDELSVLQDDAALLDTDSSTEESLVVENKEQAPGLNNCAAFSTAAAAHSTISVDAASTEASSDDKYDAVVSLQTRIAALPQPIFADISVEGSNVRDIYDTDAGVAQVSAEAHHSQVAVEVASVEARQAVITGLENDPSENPCE